ncbi:MAG: choice-of-anchor D domain-containing protein [Bacteroidetes bacterium]|nr:choice-of-anchor D domain-containing protein [Bacteroidota bacterium]
MITPRTRLIATILFLAPFMVSQAQWSSDPASNTPVCRAGNNQKAPQLASDGKGGVIVCWADEREAQHFYKIYVQRIDKDGFARWTVNGIAISPAFNAQMKPEIVADGAGGAIVVWTDARNVDTDIYAQRVDSLGNVLWAADGVSVASGSSDQADPKLVSDGNHGAIVTWSAHNGTNQDGHIFAQRIDGNGVRQWGQELQLSTSDQFETSPRIASDGSGGAYIAWVFYNNQDYDVVAQRVYSSGVPQWQNGGVTISSSSGAQDTPSLVADGTGKAFLAYYDWSSGSRPTLQIAVLNSDGTTAASMRATSTSGGQANPQLSNIGAGLLGIVWEDGRLSGKTRSYAQIIDNTGKKSWAADGVEVSNRTGNQATPYIVPDGNGGVIVCWEDMTGGVAESDMYAQRISASGSLLWSGAGVALCTAGGMQQFPCMLSDGLNGAIAVWEDYRLSFSNPEIYATRILADGTFPIGPPILTFSTKTVALGNASVGYSTTKDITLTNNGGVAVTIASATASDPQFSLTPAGNTIDPRANVTATVKFQPTRKGISNAYIVVQSNSIFGPDTVVVSGTGLAEPEIEVDKRSLNFGSVAIGSQKSLVLHISNPGNDTLRISNISTNNPVFTVAIDTREVAPGDAFDDTVRFSPAAAGPVSGELTLESDASTSPTVLSLLGTGTTAPVVTLTIDPTYIYFGDVNIGFSKDTTLTVTNTGNDSLRIASFTSGDPHFTLETPIESIETGGSRTFTLRFTPTAVGSINTFFILTSNAATSPDTMVVQGMGSEVAAVRSVQVSPGAFTLYQNYPNPFHPSTTIRYDLGTFAPVRLTVLNSLGQVAATLVDEMQHPGVHTVQWTSAGNAPGVYFYVLRVGEYEAFGSMVLMQ